MSDEPVQYNQPVFAEPVFHVSGAEPPSVTTDPDATDGIETVLTLPLDPQPIFEPSMGEPMSQMDFEGDPGTEVVLDTPAEAEEVIVVDIEDVAAVADSVGTDEDAATDDSGD